MDSNINYDEQISQSILNNMGDLSGVISRTQYQQGSPNNLNEGVNLTGVNDPSAPADIQALAQNVVNPALAGSSTGVTPGQVPAFVPQSFSGVPAQPQSQGQQPVVSDQERSRLEQLAYDASMARIEAEEEKFKAEIAGLHPEEKERRILERELGQTKEVNNWLNQRLSGVQRQMTQAEMQQQQRAKNYWVFHVAHQRGLPVENEAIRNALAGANDPQHMYRIADQLSGMINTSARATVQNQVNSGIFAAGGGTTTPASPAAVKQRSGDISGLISSRGQVAIR